MPATYTLIASNTLSSSAASVTFSSIPGTYTDLVLRCSLRGTNASQDETLIMKFNASSSNYSYTQLQATGTTPASARQSSWFYITIGSINAGSSTANTFAPVEVYIPSYTVSQNKPLSAESFFENNSTTAGQWYIFADAGLWSNTNAITSIAFSQASGRDFASGSSFFLYGIKNS